MSSLQPRGVRTATQTMDSAPGTTPDRTGTGSTEASHTSPHTSLEHQRKRLSFFGRSNSDASTQRRAQSSLNNTMPPPKGRSDNVNPPTSRPSTAQSQNRRKTNDPLDSIRKSLFGKLGFRKKDPANDQVNPPRPGSSRRSSSRLSQSSEKPNTALIPFATPSTKSKPSKEPEVPEFKNEEQYYKHRKKSSISRPFNFQHLTPTAKKHIPLLQTVDERNLTAKFWSVNAYQKPKDDLKGIEADDLSETITTQPSEVSLSRPCSSQATTEVAESLDETTFDETQETKFNPDAFETIHEVKSGPQSLDPPVKHYSSMTVLSAPSITDPENLRHLIKERGTREGSVLPTLRAATTSDVRTSLPSRPTVLPKTVSGPLDTLAGKSHREKQPLPPVPAQAVRKIPSKSSMKSGGTLGQLLPTQRYGRASSAAGSVTGSVADSFISKRSSNTVATVNSRTDVLVEPTWEDDIDFAFDQEAEASCDFDWENVAPTPEEDKAELPTPSAQPTLDDGESPAGVRLSAWLGDPPSIAGSTSSEHVNHKRGSSVGHRGFQAARTSSTDGLASPPPTLRLDSSSSGSPVPLIKASLLECEKSPYTEGEMNFPGFDSTRHAEYLSDPESSSRSSERRKSSSANSYESSGRSMKIGSDTTRWSSASSSSVSDLLQSRRKSRSSIRKSRRLSRPLEAVTSADEDDDAEIAASARLQPTRAKTDPLLMRRPSTAGDRALLFSAGRAVQRGRSATPPIRVALAGGNAAEKAGENYAGWI